MTIKVKVYYLLICFSYSGIQNILAQSQKVADSLAIIYKNDILKDTAKLELLRNLAFNEMRDLHLALKYAEQLISLSQQMDNILYLQRGYLQKGNKEIQLGDLQAAVSSYFKSLETSQKMNYAKGVGVAYGAIADTYATSKHFNNAMLYYRKAIHILRQFDETILLASVISNAGDTFLNNRMYDSALLHFKEAGMLFEKVGYLSGKAYSLGNIGMVYANTGQSDLAEANILEAVRILEELEDYSPICIYLISISDIYLEKGDERTVLSYTTKSLQIAKKYGLKDQISNANLKLSEHYERTGDMPESFKYYKNHIAYRDSVNNIQSVQRMADVRTNFEVSQKQIEVDLLSQQKRNQRIIVIGSIITSGLIFLLTIGLYRRYKFIKETNVIIEAEKNRSETLLLNILPEETALELKQHGTVQAKKFESVTVLFSDFKGFTALAERVTPEQLVKSIDFYFKEFDRIISKYGLEKIKTIGDAYMCAGGLPSVSKTHATSVIMAAREMIELVKNLLKTQDDLTHFEIRIGVHTGPVVAGIVGSMKWQYDIWGDTVNIASRMESMSEVGMVNLSETTYLEVKDEFPCEFRGTFDVKNRGPLKMYFLL